MSSSKKLWIAFGALMAPTLVFSALLIIRLRAIVVHETNQGVTAIQIIVGLLLILTLAGAMFALLTCRSVVLSTYR
jgi:hypothetical protein